MIVVRGKYFWVLLDLHLKKIKEKYIEMTQNIILMCFVIKNKLLCVTLS